MRDRASRAGPSDKDQAAGTYKGKFGFYPLAYLDRGDGTGEPLGGSLSGSLCKQLDLAPN